MARDGDRGGLPGPLVEVIAIIFRLDMSSLAADPPTNLRSKLESEIAKLDRSDPSKRDLAKELERLITAADEGRIDHTDFAAIADFWLKYDRGENKITTQETHLSNLRKTADRSDTPLIEASSNDIKRLMATFRSGSHDDVKNSGVVVNPYQSVLRVFYRWHSDLGVDPEDVNIDTDYKGRELSADDLWTQSDVDAWIEASRDGSNRGFRDRAMFALALATGQQIDAIRSLRIKHISESGPTMDLTLNDTDGNLKGASGSRPVLWAKHYLRPWIENHPFRDDPEAGLFCTIPGRGMNRKPDSERREPLDGQTLRDIVRENAEQAGIDKPTYFHILRHTAITRMVTNDLEQQKIKQIAGWDPDSSEFSTYVHLSDKLTNDGVRESLGLPTSDKEHVTIGRPTLERCPECGDQFTTDRDRCPTCHAPLTYSAEAESHTIERDGEGGATMSVETADEILDALEPVLRAREQRVTEAGDTDAVPDPSEGLEAMMDALNDE